MVVVAVAALDVIGALADDQSGLPSLFDSRKTADYGVDVDYGSVPAILLSIIHDESSNGVLPDGLGFDDGLDIQAPITGAQPPPLTELSNGANGGCNGVGNSTCVGKGNCQGVGNDNCTANGHGNGYGHENGNGYGHENGNGSENRNGHDKDKDKDKDKDNDKSK
jgi:hypothetical protein